MKKLIIAVSFLICNCCSAQTKPYPLIEDVVKYFFTTYNYVQNSDYFIRFEKRKGGWYIRKESVITFQPVGDPLLFWSKAFEYTDLPFEKRTVQDTGVINESIRNFTQIIIGDSMEAYYFHRCLYYGYEGWNWDIITELGEQQNLSDSLLESLARAYYFYGIDFLSDQFPLYFVNNDSDRVQLKPKDTISTSRVVKFVTYVHRSMAAYRRLQQLNPTYQTKIGNADAVRNNGQMLAYSLLFFSGFEKEARSFLEDVQLPDSVMKRANAILDELKPNSILFMWGDNITYPIWLLQARGKRKDILALNYDFLVSNRMFSYLYKKYANTLFSIPPVVYQDSLFKYSMFNDASADTGVITLNLFLKKLYKDHPSNTKYTFSNNNLSLPVNMPKANYLYGQKMIGQAIIMPITRNYLLICDVMAMDMIATNFLQKHIYITDAKQDMGVQYPLVKRKEVWELSPEVVSNP